MAAPKVLVVYYSRTGTTRSVAEAIAAGLPADLEEIVDRDNRGGPLGYVRTPFEAIRHRPAAIAPTKHDPAAYDLVVIGTPVWAWSPSAPVRAYLMQNTNKLPQIAFFCVMGGAGSARAFGQMQALAGKPPQSTTAFTTADVVAAKVQQRLADFVKKIGAGLIAD